MRIFITGVAGFLGSNLAELMIKEGHSVVGNDNMIGGDIQNVPLQVDFHNVDCEDLDTMTAIMYGCDVVFHCAATPHEGLSVFSPTLISENNLVGSVSTFTAAARNKVKRVVFCSSMARYGQQQAPFTEDMDPKPIDPYGVSKVAAEDILKIMGEVHGFEWNIAVPHNIVGPKQKFDDPFRNVMSIMANLNLRGKPSIIYGDGEQTRCFSYVDDCTSCLYRMGTDPNIVGETINIGPDEEVVTINRLADEVANATGYNGEPVYYSEGRPREVKHAACSSDKARKLLGFETTVGFVECVRRTVDWIKDQGPRPFEYHLPVEIHNEKTPKTWTERRFD